MTMQTFRSMRGEANSVRLEDIHEEPARDYDANDEQAIEELAALYRRWKCAHALKGVCGWSTATCVSARCV